jgi:16S rRNA (cytosine967-C5)-methyltransferase
MFGTLTAGEALAASGVSGRLAQALLATARGIVLSPRRTGTDGFYISVMRRQ